VLDRRRVEDRQTVHERKARGLHRLGHRYALRSMAVCRVTSTASRTRSTQLSKYDGSTSQPMLFRPHRAAAADVVPVPRNGSNTVSPANENIRTSRSASVSGKGAG